MGWRKRGAALITLLVVLSVSGASVAATRAPDDIRRRTIYSVMVDRFRDGRTTPYDRIYDETRRRYVSSSSSKSEHDPAHTDPYRFWGGDFKGIADALDEDFLRDLGIGALHLTPFQQNTYYDPDIFPASAYHGYHPEDWFRLDPRFGTMADFWRASRLLKRQNIGLIMDLVYNHSSARCNPAGLGRVLERGRMRFAMLDEPRGGRNFTAPTKGFYSFENDQPDALWGVGYTSTGETVEGIDGHRVVFPANDGKSWPPPPCVVDGISQPSGLADFNLADTNWNRDQRSIGAYIIRAAQYWMRASGGAIRMIRFDATTMVPPQFTLQVMDALEAGHGLYHTGFLPEIITTAPHVFDPEQADDPSMRGWKEKRTVGFSKAFHARRLTNYDYNTYRHFASVANGVKKRKGFGDLADWWRAPPNEDRSILIGFIGSHDFDRLADGNPPLKRVLLTLLMTGPRVPLVFYGDEGGRLENMHDAGWLDKTRAFMGAERMQAARTTPEYATIAKLARLRRANPAIWKGSYAPLVVGKDGRRRDWGVVIAERAFDDARVLIVVNASGREATIRNAIATSLPDGTYQNILNDIPGGAGIEAITVRDGRIIAGEQGTSAKTKWQIAPYATGVFVVSECATKTHDLIVR